MEDVQTQFIGYVTASTNKNNPLQTILELILTPFTPNINKQGIPKSEAENIITSALNMPIKMNMNNGKHNGAYPIGTISEVWLDDDVIKARSIIWKEVFPQEDTYLRKETAEGRKVGTSWEVYHKNSVKENDVEWLQGVVFAGTCIVDNPAYGDKTLITSVAEMDETTVEALVEVLDEITETPEQKLAEQVDTLVSYIYDMYYKMCQKMREEELAKNANEALSFLTEMMGMFQSSQASLQSDKESLTKELSEVKARIIKDKLYASRVEQLAPFTTLDSENYDLITSLTDDAFSFMLNGFKASASTQTRMKLPLSTGSDKVGVKELARELKERNK